MARRKYQVYKKQVSYDGGETWEDVLPVETMKMPVYGETCEVGYSAKRSISGYVHSASQVAWDVDGVFATIPPMHTLTKDWVNLLRFYWWDSNEQTKDYWNWDIHTPLIIGKEVEEIGTSAYTDSKVFYGIGVIFEKPSKVKKINSYAFLNNTAWESIDIPDSVERIESYAFAASGYSKAMYVTIGTGCTYIGDYAFADIGYSFTGELEKNIWLSGSTPPVLGNNAFGEKALIIVSDGSLSQYRSEWSGISGDVISDISLGNSAKAETNIYSGTTSVYQLPNDGSTALTYSDFTEHVSENDIKMSWLKIGDSVKTIPDNAFSGKCGGIQYLDIGSGVETIGSNAFNAYGLTSNLMGINIPDSVKSIGDGAFRGHSRVRNITIGTGCTYIGTDAFDSINRVYASLQLPDNIEYIGGGNFNKSMVGFDFKLPSSLRELGDAAFGQANTQTGVYDRNFLNEIRLPSVERLGKSALTAFFTSYLEVGGNIEDVESGQCIPTMAVAIGATTPPFVMDSSYIDNIGKIEWMKTALIYVPDPFIDTYKTTYGWCYLRQHMFPLSEISNKLNFASGHKFCGLYPKQGDTISPYPSNMEQGLFKYGEYDGSTTLTSGETKYGYSDNTPPAILWVGDNVEYVDSNVGSYGTQSVGVVVFGTGIKEFKFLDGTGNLYNSITYVFKTSTPPEFSCDNYTIAERDNGDGTWETGVTISEKRFIMYVPDGAEETYKSWLRVNGVKQSLFKGSTEIIIDDYLVYPLSEFCKTSDSLKKRWVEVPGQYQYGCSGSSKVRIAIEKEQTTTDWINWTDTGRVRNGDAEVIERFSYECGYTPYTGKLRGTKDNGRIVEVPCDGSSTLTTGNTRTIRSNSTEYIEVGDCTSYVGARAFSGYNFIQEAVLSNSVISIGDRAFSSCSGLTSCTIGSGVTSIGNSAFYKCYGLTSIEIPSGVTSIGESAFEECRSLTSIDIPSGVTSIGDYAFSSCSGLTSCTIGSGVTSIGTYAFSYCESLTSITIPNSVTTIGDDAFYGCTSLTSVTIGSGVTSIGASAFAGCSSISSMILLPTTPPTLPSYGGAALEGSYTIYVPSTAVQTYKTAWSYYESRIQQIPD